VQILWKKREKPGQNSATPGGIKEINGEDKEKT
jgi:hypothetical protein